MSRWFRSCLSLPALVVAGANVHAQQPPNPDSTKQPRPSFEHSKGPVVAIDEAHRNTHAFGTQFRGLVELLRGDGYQVRPFAQAITGRSLSGVDVLIVSGPGGWGEPDASLSDGEVADLVQWIHLGGSLLLILDHMPAPHNAARLTAALGISDWHNGYLMVEMPDTLPVGPIIFWRAEFFPAEGQTIGPTGPGGGRGYQGPDAVLAKHPITEGRTPAERVRRVATFVGSAFKPPSGAEPLLTVPDRAVSLVSAETPGALPNITRETPRSSVGGWLQGAVMKLGRGRVAVFGEVGAFSGGPAADNRTFVLNLMHWLNGRL